MPAPEWITPHCAVTEYGLPLEQIEAAILSGNIECRTACGARVVLRHEVKALRLKLYSDCREATGYDD